MTKQDLAEIRVATEAGMTLNGPQNTTEIRTIYRVWYDGPRGIRRIAVYGDIEQATAGIRALREQGTKIHALETIQTRTETSVTRWEPQEG